VVKANGGTVVGSVRHPLNAQRLLVLPAAGAGLQGRHPGLANAGGDTINAMKAAKEFGITKTMKVAGLLVFINDVHSVGLKPTPKACSWPTAGTGTRTTSAQVRQALLRQVKRMPSACRPPTTRPPRTT
jgi:branched-chain amino acid transport system substrate-binding protein